LAGSQRTGSQLSNSWSETGSADDDRPVHLVMMFGPPAVGKMAVGRELSALTSYPLFHNHMSIEPVLDVLPWGSPSFVQLTSELRRRVIEEAVVAELPGLIFTYVWAFDDPADRAYVDWLTEPVRSAGGRLDFVELYADQDNRLAREGTELRDVPQAEQNRAPSGFCSPQAGHRGTRASLWFGASLAGRALCLNRVLGAASSRSRMENRRRGPRFGGGRRYTAR
jgi:hypothetical protein